MQYSILALQDPLWRCISINDKVTKHKCHLTRFPLNNPSLLKKWVIAMKRADWKPTKYSVLCAEHFTPADYVSMGVQSIEGQAKKYLKTDAVPSIFNFPEHLVKKTKLRTPAKRKAPPSKAASPAKRQKSSPNSVKGDHGNYCKSPTKVISKLKKSLQQKNKKIKSLRSKNLRKEKQSRVWCKSWKK